MRWLRAEKDTKAQELQLSAQENARLRQDCTRYQREAAAALAEVKVCMLCSRASSSLPCKHYLLPMQSRCSC